MVILVKCPSCGNFFQLHPNNIVTEPVELDWVRVETFCLFCGSFSDIFLPLTGQRQDQEELEQEDSQMVIDFYRAHLATEDEKVDEPIAYVYMTSEEIMKDAEPSDSFEEAKRRAVLGSRFPQGNEEAQSVEDESDFPFGVSFTSLS